MYRCLFNDSFFYSWLCNLRLQFQIDNTLLRNFALHSNIFDWIVCFSVMTTIAYSDIILLYSKQFHYSHTNKQWIGSQVGYGIMFDSWIGNEHSTLITISLIVFCYNIFQFNYYVHFIKRLIQIYNLFDNIKYLSIKKVFDWIAQEIFRFVCQE